MQYNKWKQFGVNINEKRTHHKQGDAQFLSKAVFIGDCLRLKNKKRIQKNITIKR